MGFGFWGFRMAPTYSTSMETAIDLESQILRRELKGRNCACWLAAYETSLRELHRHYTSAYVDASTLPELERLFPELKGVT